MNYPKSFSGRVYGTEFYWDSVTAGQDRIADEIANAMVQDGAKRVTIDLTDDHAWYAFSGESL